MTSRPSYALTTNGRINGELKDRFDTDEEVIAKRLALLDGVTRYSLSLWRLPDGVAFDKVDLRIWPQEFIQAAGSRTCMTVEIRRFEHSIARQFVVGRATASSPAANLGELVVISWDEHETHVGANEVFDADEAARLFVAYRSGASSLDGYDLRVLRRE